MYKQRIYVTHLTLKEPGWCDVTLLQQCLDKPCCMHSFGNTKLQALRQHKITNIEAVKNCKS